MAEEAARAVACGIEYLHTASLVFDDLPAMDDARMRRGAHLCSRHPWRIDRHARGTGPDQPRLLRCCGRASRGRNPHAGPRPGDWVDARLGIHGVIGGQAYDLSGWRGGQSAANVSEVAARKTGDLLRLTLVLPAILGLRHTPGNPIAGPAWQTCAGLPIRRRTTSRMCSHPESAAEKSGGRDEELGRPNLVAAEGLPAALARFHRLCRAADRVQAALPGPPARWGMLDLLRVPLPAILAQRHLPVISAAADLTIAATNNIAA